MSSFAESPEGLLFYSDGFGPVLRWDGFTPQAELAGVVAPTVAPAIAGSGTGGIMGTYRAYLRFVDAYGNVSDLSPVSADLTTNAGGGSVTGATLSDPINLTIVGHGLFNGARIKVEGIIGQTGANGTWDVIVVDRDTVTLVGSVSANAYVSGGTWTVGVNSIAYTGVQAATDSQVRRRQILRNTDGQALTYYVDVDTNDLTTTTFSSTKIDSLLSAQTPVPVLDSQGADLANVHGRPPQDKPFLALHQNRLFAAGSVEYAEGAVAVTYGSTAVTGVGSEWTPAVAGRFLYVVGADTPYEVMSVNTAAQTLTLATPYKGTIDHYAAYALRSPPATANTAAYSEAGLCESMPAVNALSLADDGDVVTGVMSKGSFLYFLKRRHIYRLTFQDGPAEDGGLFLAARRGCVNNRCYAVVEDAAYMLDEQGVHVFDQGKSDGSISTPILDLFRGGRVRFSGDGPQINWSASRWFHCVHDPATETIRWFVAMSGQYLPRHAICFQYTLQRWWLEEYPFPVSASGLGKLARQASAGTWGVGREQVFLGATGRRVLALGAGDIDGPDPDSGPTAGAVVSAGVRSLTGPAPFAADVVGMPVVVTAGRGAGQLRIVTDASGATLNVSRPWLVTPDDTSKFQVGGIPWRYQSGWFRLVESEDNNSRRVELMFEPGQPGARMLLRRYRDRTTTPVPAALGRDQDGVKSTVGSGDLEIALDRPSGFVQARAEGSKELYAQGQRLISVGLAGYGGPGNPTQIYQINIDGATDGGG